MRLDRYRAKLLPGEIRNLLYFLLVRFSRRMAIKFTKSDVAYMYVEHAVILPFIVNIMRYLKLNIHFVKPHEDFSNYRKIIVPNGLWPSIRKYTDRLPKKSIIYCEIGFLPQTKNVYFDAKGVHGHSSIRDAKLEPLELHEQRSLAQHKRKFAAHDYVRVKWGSIDLASERSSSLSNVYDFDFLFVPLQLTRDTAFELCPFSDNQEVIDFVQKELPNERIVFKTHPSDDSSGYCVAQRNILLPAANKDLRLLLESCKAVVAANSTVILEALMLRKKCATYGIGFTTNHNITLECHDNLHKLSQIEQWEPDWNKVDRFLWLLLNKQVSVDFPKCPRETTKLANILRSYGVLK